MFEALTEKLEHIFKKLRGRGILKEEDVEQALREVRIALLEADVNYKVVKDFISSVKQRAVGSSILESLTPGQQVIKIVHEELIALMGSSDSKIKLAANPPTIIMMVGLQGSGKTTTSAKLANYYKSEGRRPMLVAADIKRPAAIEQLITLGTQLGIPVFYSKLADDPVKICEESIIKAKTDARDIVILDTAGRLHIDEELMEELKKIKEKTSPHEILLVVDAMTGQEAVNVASSFNERLSITGIVLTKMDGDARGGAALSMRAVTGRPIKFIGTGERLNAIEPFYAERIASRILGMGDVLSLIEKVQKTYDIKEAERLEKKVREDDFDLDDLRLQIRKIKSMGSLESLLSMIPGFNKLKGINIDTKEFVKIEAIINSMTPQERRNPSILNGSRRRRIALGSGTTVADVNRLLKQYNEMKKLMKAFKGKKGMRLPNILPL
ncbi:MAG: signal recognition particle protein [Thermodesulfovibrionales bacterium]|nr:signal recognition particle protein [Thermodesulfovibrionales bacterium]